MSGFTPGPWAVSTCHQGESCWCRIIMVAGHEDEDSLEHCIVHSGAIGKENANLIAAAPDYDAGVEQMLAYEQAGGDGWWKGWEMLKAAHAKARGEQA